MNGIYIVRSKNDDGAGNVAQLLHMKPWIQLPESLDMRLHACNPSIWEIEAEWLKVQVIFSHIESSGLACSLKYLVLQRNKMKTEERKKKEGKEEKDQEEEENGDNNTKTRSSK